MTKVVSINGFAGVQFENLKAPAHPQDYALAGTSFSAEVKGASPQRFPCPPRESSSILNSKLDKPVLVAVAPFDERGVSSDCARELFGKPTPGYFSLTRNPELEIAHSRGEYGALIVVDPESRPETEQWIRAARRIHHFPAIVHLKGEGMAELVGAGVVPKIFDWEKALSKNRQLRGQLLELKESRQPTPEMVRKEVQLIAAELRSQKRPDRLSPRESWGGLLHPPSVNELMQLATAPGAEVFTLRRDNTLYGYAIHFPEPLFQPQRSFELAAALAVHGKRPLNPTHLVLLGVTPAGRALDKFHGSSLYDLLHNRIQARSRECGSSALLAEVRAHPFPHADALRADMARGWERSEIFLPQKIGKGLGTAVSEVISLDLQKERVIRAEPLEPLNARKSTLGADDTRQWGERDKALWDVLRFARNFGDATYWIGNAENSREIVRFRCVDRDTERYEFDYRCWNLDWTNVLVHRQREVSPNHTIFLREFQKVIDLVRGHGTLATITNADGSFHDTRALLASASFAFVRR